MRLSFRTLLPAAQAAFAIALLLTNSGAPKFRSVSRCDWDPSVYCTPEIPEVVARLVESNLPAVPVVAPLYVWLGGPEHPNLPSLVTLLGLAGIGIWFFVGQFLDDFVAALMKRLGPRRHIHDGLFSTFIIISSSVVFVESGLTSFALSSSQLVIRVSSLCWLVFGCTALLFQIGWSSKGGPVTGFVPGRRS
jgi:hypothetical protein